MVFASVWESWVRDRAELRSTAIITTSAGADTEGVHDRMPVVLEPDALDVWLDRSEGDREILEPLLRSAPRGTLVVRAVGSRVGKVSEDDPALITPEASAHELGASEPVSTDSESCAPATAPKFDAEPLRLF
jgi:putative SOS response-associated peptidase YedK